jgi:hypothetical protein
MEKIRIRDPGWKNSDPGSGMEKIRIRDIHPGSTHCSVLRPGLRGSGWKRFILESWIRICIRVTIHELKWLKMDSRRAVDDHNGGVEAQKNGAFEGVYRISLDADSHHYEEEQDPDPY